MYFILNLLKPNNSGAPDYNTCGQATAVLSFIGQQLSVNVEGENLFTSTDLAGDLIAIAASCPLAIGATGLTLQSFAANVATGAVILEITGINTYDEKVLSVIAGRANHYSYENSFKLFGYDLGNEAGVSTGNPDISILLIPKANIVDAYGLQMRTHSRFTTYQKPFTNKTFVYNLVGTTGEIAYYNGSDGIGGGQNAVICNTSSMTLTQIIIVRDKDCNVYDTCSSDVISNKSVWYPPVNKSAYSNLNCNQDCTSNADTNSIDINIDYAAVTVFNINGELNWLFSPNEPTETLYEQLVFELINYNGEVIETSTVDVTTFYSDWISNPATPTTFNFTMPEFGDVIAKVKYQIVKESDDTVIIECIKLQTYNSCNFWNVSNDEACGDYIVNNCSTRTGTLVVSLMQEDSSFSQVSTLEVEAMTNYNLTLQADGIYKFTLCYEIDEETVCESYIIPNFCSFIACYKAKLDTVICEIPCENCNVDIHYNFNAFLINAQTFLSLLNKELNYNYFYTGIIPTEKVAELYTMKLLQDRLAEYCVTECNTTCNCS